MGVRYFALISGIVYVLIGLFGFIPGMVATPGTGGPEVTVGAGYGYLLSTFPVNILHNFVHIAVGIWGIVSPTVAAWLPNILGLLAATGLLVQTAK